MEFAAYNLLCAILHSNNKRDLLSLMSRWVENHLLFLYINLSFKTKEILHSSCYIVEVSFKTILVNCQDTL